jgi:molecular chaperone DnaK
VPFLPVIRACAAKDSERVAMAERREPIVGIDLGTTYSVVAALDPSGRPATVPNRQGDLSTPSVVLFEDERVIVGKEAQRAALHEPDRVAECAKRDVGSRYYHRPVAGKQISPEMVLAIILKRLKSDAERRLGLIRHVVITVPAYFDHTRREATCEAARLAGLQVTGLLNEPSAAALAYGFQEGFLDASGALADRQTVRPGVMTVVVYDLGGGTFDVTVMQIRERKFKTLATDGDVRLGGRDWDQRIVDQAAKRYLADHPNDDPRDDPVTLQTLFKEAEEAKRTLSERTKTRLTYPRHGNHVVLEITRAEFEANTADLLERTRATTKLLMNEAGLEWSEVDKLLLSGGSTRMPQVARMLRELSGQAPDRSLSPDEAVAHGAALYHGMLQSEKSGQPSDAAQRPQIINVNAHSLGLVTRTRAPVRLLNSILIPRNTALPHSGSQVFRTGNTGQSQIHIRIVEGESPDPRECNLLGKFSIEPLPAGLPAGSPIRLHYSYDESGRIKVRAVVDVPSLQTEVRIARRGSTIGQNVDDWAIGLLNRAGGDDSDD